MLRTASLWFAALTAAVPLAAQFQSVRIQVIDRGQADGIVIRTPNTQWIVIDAGTNAQQANAIKNDWGVEEVALAVVSHRHFDHHGGMDSVLQELTVQRFLGITENCPTTQSDDTVRDLIQSRNVPLVDLGVGTIEIDGVTIRVLPQKPPPPSECPDEENNNSVVVRLEFGEFSMLFTGDAETEELNFLADNHADLLDADVLKA